MFALGTPEDRVKFLRKVFDQIVVMDPFVTLAKPKVKVWRKPVNGEDLAKAVK